MRRIIDLSQEITHRGPARPFHPTPTIWTHISHAETRAMFKSANVSFEIKGLTLSDHTGTHVDAFAHFDSRPEAQTIDQIPLELFYTEAICLDFSYKAPATSITSEDILQGLANAALEIKRGDTFLYYAAHYERNFGTPRWWTDFPGLDAAATEFLADAGVVNIGCEAFSIENPANANVNADRPYPAHLVCLRRQVLNTENLKISSSVVGKRFTFIGFPLKIQGGTAAPIRAVAILEE